MLKHGQHCLSSVMGDIAAGTLTRAKGGGCLLLLAVVSSAAENYCAVVYLNTYFQPSWVCFQEWNFRVTW